MATDLDVCGEPLPAPWQIAFRKGLVPQLDPFALSALRTALEDDDPRLAQGVTCAVAYDLYRSGYLPPKDEQVCCSACLIAFLALNSGKVTHGEIHRYFGAVTSEIDRLVGHWGACKSLLNFWDDTLRKAAREAMIAELDLLGVERICP